MTIGNAKAVDLFAEKGDKRIAIQVKAIYQKKIVGWPIQKIKSRRTFFISFLILMPIKWNNLNISFAPVKKHMITLKNIKKEVL